MKLILPFIFLADVALGKSVLPSEGEASPEGDVEEVMEEAVAAAAPEEEEGVPAGDEAPAADDADQSLEEADAGNKGGESDQEEASPAPRKLYTPDWESLDSRPLPSWYDEAKIGIFMHFGPYAVPGKLFSKEACHKINLYPSAGVQSEWFWMQSERNKYSGDKNVVKFLKEYYPPKWTYQNFGPQLTMEFFNANQFADIVADSGAK